MLEENKELKTRFNKNSKNSSKPPSSDGLNKPKPKSLRKSSDKSKDDHKNHQGSGLKMTKAPDEIIICRPSNYINCPNLASCTKRAKTEKRNVIETWWLKQKSFSIKDKLTVALKRITPRKAVNIPKTLPALCIMAII